MNSLEEYKELSKDIMKTARWIGDNIENEENAVILITWLNKMSTQMKDNLEKLIKLREEENQE